MKKALLFICFLSLGTVIYAQTAREKKAAQVDLDNVKRLYDRLKEYKIDTKTELIWEYSYQDSTETKLKELSESFEKEGLTFKEIVPSKKSNKIVVLTVFEKKKYSKPEDVNNRAKQLNDIAITHHILSPYAVIGAEKQEKEEEIGRYKKVGK